MLTTIEEAENYVWEYLNDVQLQSTEFISITGTVENLLMDGWSYAEIIDGDADGDINDAIEWLD
jgi:hypothetical protein